MTSTASSVGMEAEGRNAPKTPLHEAVERLEALANSLRDRDVSRFVMPAALAERTAADLRTVLSHLRQVEEREAVKDRVLAAMWDAADGLSKAFVRDGVHGGAKGAALKAYAAAARKARTALTRSPSTDGTENAGE